VCVCARARVVSEPALLRPTWVLEKYFPDTTSIRFVLGCDVKFLPDKLTLPPFLCNTPKLKTYICD